MPGLHWNSVMWALFRYMSRNTDGPYETRMAFDAKMLLAEHKLEAQLVAKKKEALALLVLKTKQGHGWVTS